MSGTVRIAIGSIITAISGFLGGMDGIMYTLLAFVTIDYITGVSVAAKQEVEQVCFDLWKIVNGYTT